MRLERRRGSPPSEGGVAAASADGVVHECEARKGSRGLRLAKFDAAEATALQARMPAFQSHPPSATNNNDELRTTNYEPRTTNYELRTTNHMRVAEYQVKR